jgi:hypothetical protein
MGKRTASARVNNAFLPQRKVLVRKRTKRGMKTAGLALRRCASGKTGALSFFFVLMMLPGADRGVDEASKK